MDSEREKVPSGWTLSQEPSSPPFLDTAIQSETDQRPLFPVEISFALLDQAALIFHRRLLLDPFTGRVIVFDAGNSFSSDDIRQFADSEVGKLEALRFLIRMDDADRRSTLPLQDLWRDGFRLQHRTPSEMPERFHLLNTLFVDDLESLHTARHESSSTPRASLPVSDDARSLREAPDSPVVQGSEHWLL